MGADRAASAIAETTSELGGALGVAVLGSILLFLLGLQFVSGIVLSMYYVAQFMREQSRTIVRT